MTPFPKLSCRAPSLMWPVLVGVLVSFQAPAQIQLSLQMQSSPVVTVTGPAGTPCQVQWTDNLLLTGRWFHLAHRVLSPTGVITDSTAPFGDSRFYRAVRVPGTNMVLIPAGTFAMGDTLTNGFPDELPVHTLFVSAFYMDRCEVTKVLWDEVYQWASTNGYSFDNAGFGKATNHPAQTLNWYDAVKWCNARSQQEGRTPAYYTNGGQTNVYKTGQLELTNGCVKWAANGYRLPTEAEWEKAARGGADGQRFPWGNSISHSNANYYGVTYLTYDVSGIDDFNPAYSTGAFPYTSPAGSFSANAYGLYDLAGNVWEWCWDGYDAAWYGNAGATQSDTHGPPGAVTNRVLRGGSWLNDASFARCANRIYTLYQTPTSTNDALGFRCVISVPVPASQPFAPATLTSPARLPDGSFRFTIINLTPGRTNIVAVSTNLVTWTPVWTNVPAASAVEFTNAPAPGVRFQLYRSWQVP